MGKIRTVGLEVIERAKEIAKIRGGSPNKHDERHPRQVKSKAKEYKPPSPTDPNHQK
jgi:hypothetical protein